MAERDPKPYPYARPKMFEFLKAAIKEGAHKKVPDKRNFRAGVDPEIEWVKIRNIAGIYFTSPALLEDIGSMYGYKAEREEPSRIIEKFVLGVWKNSSDALTRKYPINELEIRKPLTKGSRFKISRGLGGKLELIDRLLDEGKSAVEIAGIIGISVSKLSIKARKLGWENLPVSAVRRNKELSKSISNLPEDFEGRQCLIDQVERRFLDSHSEYFIRLQSLLRGFGIRWQYGESLDQFICQMQETGVVVKVIEVMVKSKKFRNIFMFKKDVEWHLGQIKEKLSLNPSETLSPNA